MWEVQKMEVLEIARWMDEKGLVVGTSGNVSQRFREPDGRELVAITPSGRYYDTMKAEDIVIVDMEGQRVEGELAPSMETMMHLGIYKARKKVCAVVHTHAVFGSAIAVTGKEIPSLLDDQVTFLGGEIKVAAYALPGSPELAKNAVAALGSRNAVVLANHGTLTVGRNLREAFNNCELLEKTARIYVLAMGLGALTSIPADMAEVEKAFFAGMFGEG
ncbi:MAG TPA: class II aldolase/adducin family protein [Dehalococcoidia bacterium]|nr:class II aldolase/adducin family protein [Dehalococcoidia bacterium]